MRGIALADHARLLRSTAFRLAVTYLAFFSATALLLLGAVYWTSTTFIDKQIRETINTEITGLADRYRQQGVGGLLQVISERSALDRDRKSLYLLTDSLYRPITGNLVGWPEATADAQGWLSFTVQTQTPAGVGLFDATGRVFRLPGDYNLLVGRSLRDADQVKSALRQAIGFGMALTVLLGLIGGVLTSRMLLDRVEAITRTMRGIMGGDIGRRVPNRGSGDEFDQLAQGINAALDQIERLLESMRTVTDNVAHDLRTPLQRLRSRIDVALLGEADADDYRRALEETMADADRLLATFNALLTIAQAEAGDRANRLAPLELLPLARDLVELYEPLAEEKGVRLRLAPASHAGKVMGDRHLLSQALANLVDNAVKYTPEGGAVTVTVDDGHCLAVADTGPGIPAEARERVLEPFVRLDATRSTSGNGLGLSLVQAVARLHGARLELAGNDPGLVVRLWFPKEQAGGSARSSS